jgi:hypothetical protein
MPPRAAQQEEGYFFLAHFNFVLFTVDFIAVIICTVASARHSG